jgi:hypothetical protein
MAVEVSESGRNGQDVSDSEPSRGTYFGCLVVYR